MKRFSRVAIVNRGEPAMRFLHAAREYSIESKHRLTTIALTTDADRRALFVREADEVYNLGATTFVDPKDNQRKPRYLDYEALERALVDTRAEAVWVGWGFVAEQANFVDLCQRLGIVFMGPSAEVMRALGDKISSKRLAENAGVSVLPWSHGPVESLDDARRHAKELGFPIMVKATSGGGGRGIRRVRSADQLEEAFSQARHEANNAFGDSTVFLESMMSAGRHVEVQIIADSAGSAWALGVRDCTIQRRNQKVVEETPCPTLTAEVEKELQDQAIRLVKHAAYQGAGTVEFLYDSKNDVFSFMEVNARLQVEHPVTELTTDSDLVKLQIHIAQGGLLEGEAPRQSGHAIEVRLCAEDPHNQFMPSPGTIERLRLPGGTGIRVDTGVEEGDKIPAEFDSMIAKIIAYGRTRDEALARLERALLQTSVVIRGGASNKGFLLGLVRREEVWRAHDLDVSWLDGEVANNRHLEQGRGDVALVATAIHHYEADTEIAREQFFMHAARGRPDVKHPIGRQYEFEYEGNPYHLSVRKTGPTRYVVSTDGVKFVAEVVPSRRKEWRLSLGDSTFRVLVTAQGRNELVEVDGIPHRVSLERGDFILAPVPGVLVSFTVAEGDHVKVGDRLAVLEAMKTEMAVTAEFSGRVAAIKVPPNTQVDTGQAIMEVEHAYDDDSSQQAERLALAHFAEQGSTIDDQQFRLNSLRRFLLGYDVDATDLLAIVREKGTLCDDVASQTEAIQHLEDQVLAIFLDVCTLLRPQSDDDNEFGGRSTKEYFFSYLRDTGARGEELPSAFATKLNTALAHYGVKSLEPTSELSNALFRLFISHQRVASISTLILSVLDRRLEFPDQARQDAGFRELLERIIGVTQRRFPDINDSALEVRYRLFDQPRYDDLRGQVYAQAERNLEQLIETSSDESRAELTQALVECPQPLKGFLSKRLHTATNHDERWAILEVITRRYYRRRTLESVTRLQRDDRIVASGEYGYDNSRIRLLTTFAPQQDMRAALSALKPLVEDTPSDKELVIEVYLSKDGTQTDESQMSGEMRDALDQCGFNRPIRRVVITAVGLEFQPGPSGAQLFTFRSPNADTFEEDRLYRGIHPMMAKRLDFWRLSEFKVERLPSAEDIFLLRAAGRENPRDERLIALAEVRDATPLRDSAGRATAVPHLERMLLESLASIRRFQARRPTRGRLHWNRVQLFVWPTLDLRPEELSAIAHRLAPATEGLGLERVLVAAKITNPATGSASRRMIDISNPAGSGVDLGVRDLPTEPLQPLSPYTQKVVSLRRRGLIYPYELATILNPRADNAGAELPPGEFVEYDLNQQDELVPVKRPAGENTSNIVVGVSRSFTAKHPEGMSRVSLFGDPSRGMGSLAESECQRIMKALDLAEKMDVPLEWFAVSAGARISMESGTENMDWIAWVLKRIIEFTQAGGEINVIVCGINVGAQPYWNAEATMLMHTRGVLIMLPNSAMVLTGKHALDYSGGVSAEDNEGIGGYERIMGPNGQAQYLAKDLLDAVRILFQHYDHTYRCKGERFPRLAETSDHSHRDVCNFPYGNVNGTEFATIGEIFSEEHNPGRKKPFDMRRVMQAIVDQDQAPLERWFGMQNAETAVIWDAHLGGHPVCLIGLESRPITRVGFVPADGPKGWTGGTLFPMSSKKVARSINSASGNRPLVVLANLSGFDGSPESMRELQLEYGAEIGRAVVNFDGPIVFLVISRFHGGAFVVFSNKLNDALECAALEGTHASVIGGAPAAAVVFAGEVKKRVKQDTRMIGIERAIAKASGSERSGLRAKRDELVLRVESEKRGEIADEFDAIHSVQRAKDVGSVHTIIEPTRLRPYLVEAIARGKQKFLQQT